MRKTHEQVATSVDSNGAYGVSSSYLDRQLPGHLLKTPF